MSRSEFIIISFPLISILASIVGDVPDLSRCESIKEYWITLQEVMQTPIRIRYH